MKIALNILFGFVTALLLCASVTGLMPIWLAMVVMAPLTLGVICGNRASGNNDEYIQIG